MPTPVEIEEQEIKENHFLENLKLIPGQVRKWFTTNVVTRTLSHVVGWTGTHAKMLLCTSAGILKVAPTGTGFEHSEVKSADAIYAVYHDLDFTNECSRFDIWVYGKDIKFKRKNDVDVWEGETVLKANGFYSFDCYGKSIEVIADPVTDKCSCQVSGWY